MNVRPVFFALLCAYVVYAVVTNRRPEAPKGQRPHTLALLVQGGLFLFACFFGWEAGAFSRDLVSPLYLLLGLAGGHVLFSFSLAFTHGVPRDALGHLCDIGAITRFFTESPALLLRFTAISFSEELIYRAAAQTQLIAWTGRPVWSVFVVGAAFSIVHRHFFDNSLAQAVEFLAFSVLLGALYYATGSLSLVIVIHTVRNLESVYLEYVAKVELCGDANAALDELEQQYVPRGLRQA